jgi:hypothetical protein
VAPCARASAASNAPFESKRWPCSSVVPGSTSSSPVTSSATRTRGRTASSRRPNSAATPRCAGVSRTPRGDRERAARVVVVAARTFAAARGARSELDRRAVAARVLEDHHGVGAARQRRTRRDAHALARRDRVGTRAAREPRADLAQLRRRIGAKIGAAHRIAVHRRMHEARHVARRDERLDQYPSCSVVERHGFIAHERRADALAHERARALELDRRAPAQNPSA